MFKKQSRLTTEDRLAHPEYGDTYTFVALDPSSKMVIAFLVGKRNQVYTDRFIANLSQRIDGDVQLSTDGYGPYIAAIQRHFGYRATHAELVKTYAAENPGPGRYAPPKVTGVTIYKRWGIPDRSSVYLLCRTQQLDDSLSDSPIYQISQWVLSKGGKPHGSRNHAVLLL